MQKAALCLPPTIVAALRADCAECDAGPAVDGGADLVAPALESLTPSAESTEVEPSIVIEATFSVALEPAKLEA